MHAAFVTGGSGFIGRRLIVKLVERGVHVRVLSPSMRDATLAQSLGAVPVSGDLFDEDALRAGIKGCDAVFHLAAVYDMSGQSWRETEMINVEGTRCVLTIAAEMDVKKIVYSSTIGIYGDTAGELVDESYRFEGPWANHYERTMWLAYHDVVLPLMEGGLPIVAVLVGGVYGQGHRGPLGELMSRFYFHRFPFPFLVAPGTILTLAHVDDVADGHILASERGGSGESYILAGPAVSLGELVDFWARLTGKRPPSFHVPAPFIRLLVPLAVQLDRFFDLPDLFAPGTLRMAGHSYMASSAKAQEELGWRMRSIQAGLLETFADLAADAADHPRPLTREREFATIALGAAALVLIAWLLNRIRTKN